MKTEKTIDLKSVNLSGTFIGYYWMSDGDTPKLINGPFPLTPGNNPYIIEANVYDSKAELSISTGYIDGVYLIDRVTKEDFEFADKNGKLVEQKYITHRLVGCGKAIFVRAWLPEEDPECADMPVLQPAWRAFRGFTKVINTKEA